MKILLLTALLLVASMCADAQQPTVAERQATDIKQELIKLNQELIDALARGDKAVMARIYADEFVRTTVQGGVLTKAQLLASVKAPEAGGAKISYESKDIQVIDYGNAAVMIYLSIRHTDDKGEKSDFLYRVTDTFVKRDGRWLKAASAGTPVVAERTAAK